MTSRPPLESTTTYPRTPQPPHPTISSLSSAPTETPFSTPSFWNSSNSSSSTPPPHSELPDWLQNPIYIALGGITGLMVLITMISLIVYIKRNCHKEEKFYPIDDLEDDRILTETY